MTWALLALWTSLTLVVVSFIIGVVDEIRRPPSSVRRAGLGLALVAGFAAMWLLSTPVWVDHQVNCGRPLFVLTLLSEPHGAVNEECSAPTLTSAVAGLVAALAAPVLVLSTRQRPD